MSSCFLLLGKERIHLYIYLIRVLSIAYINKDNYWYVIIIIFFETIWFVMHQIGIVYFALKSRDFLGLLKQIDTEQISAGIVRWRESIVLSTVAPN